MAVRFIFGENYTSGEGRVVEVARGGTVMGWIFLVVAAVLFFLAAVGSTVIPNATSWGLVALAIGLAVGERGAGLLKRS